jgi:hypothetical protein
MCPQDEGSCEIVGQLRRDPLARGLAGHGNSDRVLNSIVPGHKQMRDLRCANCWIIGQMSSLGFATRIARPAAIAS